MDILVDERLCSDLHGKNLLSAQPSPSGELWVCYIEKAVAIHCGGWDELEGGSPTRAWSILLGCKETYTIMKDGEGYRCHGAYNPNEKRWETLANSPNEGFQGAWPMPWPDVGGGGSCDKKASSTELFHKMCAWDDKNYIMAAGNGGDDSRSSDGIVQGHAYSVVRCLANVAGTEFDLVQMRNSWGFGEFGNGMWDDDGPGWDQYPAVKAALSPVNADDGIFWLSKEEFFKYFDIVHLCAKDMSEFCEEEHAPRAI